MRIHRVITTGLPMPATIKGDQGPRLQGGLPPVAWRNGWTRAGDTGRYARVHGERRTMPTPEWVTLSDSEMRDRARFAARNTSR